MSVVEALLRKLLTWTRYQGRVRISAAKPSMLGLPADISFSPYISNLSCRDHLLAGFKVDQSAPASLNTIFSTAQHSTAQRSTAQHSVHVLPYESGHQGVEQEYGK